MTAGPRTIGALILEEAGDERRRLVATAAFAGGANAMLLALVNTAAATPADVGLGTFALFATGLWLYFHCTRYSHRRCIVILESALHRLKRRVVRKIQAAELAGLERIGAAEIYDRITENTAQISTLTTILANLLHSLVVLACAALYIAWVSLPAFMVVGLLVGITALLYRAREEAVYALFGQLLQIRVGFLDTLTDLVRGFKEVKLSRARERSIRADLGRFAEALRDITVRCNHLFDDNWVFANCSLFAVLAVVLGNLSPSFAADGDARVALVTAVLFLWGPLSTIALATPSYLRANSALGAIDALERKLGDAARTAPAEPTDPWNGRLEVLVAEGVGYTYEDRDSGQSFVLEPIDLTIRAGEVVFIVGGNGSGKSTLLKVLTGLYAPSTGGLKIDGVTVDADNLAAYRELFTTVFADFHLFSELYGLHDLDPAAVQRLIVQMQLTGKTEFARRGFTRRDLSTGQRKRLAMIVSLLEDRPIFVLDEWAADQDPEFRAYFYDTLLPDLRRRGKAVLAVSHDDRYFHTADRVMTLESGRVRSIEDHRHA
ncbi:cyclic peptide export ABC transporter [Nannocystis radixulma]|uniref:Cyclic peptide export ABC transporter n=1 Tax=Nannocystis radixulma TaxID=2995305 RepID=A0ABT5BCW6_9BACT|nr:cyclic peptide export ABC transporter [Nannocystis radixulma]MDC0671979.1 cyclic peptide export ABC transporter [Nannocystis radixulma]